MVVGILFVALIFQGVLAAAVYSDAYERGDDEGLWLAVTLVLGVVGVLLYLLNRPDERIPEDQQQRSASTVGLKVVGLYIGSLVAGFVLAVITSSIYLQNTMAPNGNVVFFPSLFIPPIILFAYRQRRRISNTATSS